jgi:hypothetical protein
MMAVMNAFIAIILAFIGGVITLALGYDYPLPFIVAGIVFLAYFGVAVFVFDADFG